MNSEYCTVDLEQEELGIIFSDHWLCVIIEKERTLLFILSANLLTHSLCKCQNGF